jgi:hypothetical protein
VLDGVARRPWDLRPIQELGADARAGTLPSFSWVEPRYFTFADFDEEDQHPTRHDRRRRGQRSLAASAS